jgi:hypothetical protein
MLGVIADRKDHDVVSEFFELFKTPWEFYQSDRSYPAVLCLGESDICGCDAKLVILYAGRPLKFDTQQGVGSGSQTKGGSLLSYGKKRLPVYGDSITFPGGGGVLVDAESQRAAMYCHESSGKIVVRVGYDLLAEARTLLTEGQPLRNASLPALELHIALLRDLIVTHRIPLIEIPPVPQGYRLIACLTHDVDHPSIRRHKFDHTMFGFLYRALVGSLLSVLRGRVALRHLLTNWAAACKLPLVYLGLAKDFWGEFVRYPQLEMGARSTFFVIPFAGRAGRSLHGAAQGKRATRYAATDVAVQIDQLMSAKCEIAAHGIDAWLDSSSGRAEIEQIRKITGQQEIGVRMHWLYFAGESPVILEQGGADYDSSVGYNETVGYRAGTTQVYKPLCATRMLELPLHIMDTALFYPGYLGLTKAEARERVSSILDNAMQFGGIVTVNWHDRSIAPERLWGDFYTELVAELKRRGAWFATAAQTVAWFRKRRSAVFENVRWETEPPRVRLPLGKSENLPDLQLRVHNRERSAQEAIANTSHLNEVWA